MYRYACHSGGGIVWAGDPMFAPKQQVTAAIRIEAAGRGYLVRSVTREELREFRRYEEAKAIEAKATEAKSIEAKATESKGTEAKGTEAKATEAAANAPS